MKYSSAINLRIDEVMKILQHLTLENAILIKTNLETLNSYDEETKKKEHLKIFKKNNELTKISVGYIDLHTRLFSFVKSLQNIVISDIDIINMLAQNDDLMFDRDEYLSLTINETISYNFEHPFYNDESFRQDLIKYYTKNERYEKCVELRNKK